MTPRTSHALALVLVVAAGALPLLHCSAQAPATDDASEDAVTGINNPLGLGLRFDEAGGRVQATLKEPLATGERLFVRVRRGKLTVTSQKELDCATLTQAHKLGDGDPQRREATGKVVYQGPAVDKAIVDLVNLYDDPGWATGDVSADKKEQVRLGPDPIVEACILKGDKVRAKLQTNLAYAWDQAAADEKALHTANLGMHFLSGDAGLDDEGGSAGGGTDDAGRGGGGGTTRRSENDPIESQTAYGELCVQELGEIPFFPKISDGKYETFDCRDYVASHGDGAPVKIPGVEGAGIPITSARQPISDCDADHKLGPDTEEYNCVKKCDEGMFLSPGACQPGPSVVTAKNEQGTHWVLLCRKVSDDGHGMLKSKMFNDIAMIGHNPRTGRTCFFQNSIGSGRDGAHVTHPADREKSSAIWSVGVQSYCSGSCHAADPFVHSKWIDGAKRSTGKPVIPMMGQHPDFPVSNLESPYNIVGADVLGFEIPKQLVNAEVGPCANCHRLAGNTANTFARWATGTGDDYFSKITDFGKKFEESHWMPQRLDGLSSDNWDASKYAKAMEVISRCGGGGSDATCEWADIPRGQFANPSR